MKRITGVLFAASKQVPLELFSSAEFEDFLSTTGGVSDESKTEYLRFLPTAYEAVSRMSSHDTGIINVNSFTKDS